MKKLLLVILLSSCNSQLRPLPVISTYDDVKTCQYLGMITGRQIFGKELNWEQIARFNALERAEEYGATNVVILKNLSNGDWGGEETVKGYICQDITPL